MNKIIYSFGAVKDYVGEIIKTENDCFRKSSKCKSYKMSKEEIEKYLSKYDK